MSLKGLRQYAPLVPNLVVLLVVLGLILFVVMFGGVQ